MPKVIHNVLCQDDLRPSYYDNFECLISACRLNCCSGYWHITFGKKDYTTLKKQKGSLKLNTELNSSLRRIREDIDEEYRYGEFTLQNGACPLLRDGKCGLQMEKGPEVLPFVCRTFPRTETPMPSGYLERTLTPGCECVLALLWDLPEGISFLSDPLPPSKQKLFTYEEIPDQPSLLPHFQDIRSLCIDILQDRRRPLPERMLLLGMILQPLSKGETDIPAWLTRSQVLLESGETSGLIDSSLLPMFLLHNLNTVISSDDTDPSYLAIQQEIRSLLGHSVPNTSRGRIQLTPYLAARQRFQELFSDREYFFENLIVTVFFHLRMPDLHSPEMLWRSYVNLCNLYSAYRFLSVMSCREGIEDPKTELFTLIVLSSRALIHNRQRQNTFRDDLFRHDSATLAHMAILLAG